jgi:hypothetical protein
VPLDLAHRALEFALLGEQRVGEAHDLDEEMSQGLKVLVVIHIAQADMLIRPVLDVPANNLVVGFHHLT